MPKHPDKTDGSSTVPEPTKQPEWGEERGDHFGYASEEERLDKRGLEDWEMVENIPESQGHIPYWFIAVFVVLLLVAIGFNFPFWGDRPGHEREWFNWGLPAAVVYVTVASVIIYWLVDIKYQRAEKKEKEAEREKAQQSSDDSNNNA